MRRPGVLIGALLIILLLCAGVVYLDQTGALGSAGTSGSSSSGASSSSGSSTTNDPYGGLK